MNRVNFLVVLACWIFFPIAVYAQGNNAPPMELTIEKISWASNIEIETICWVDKKENTFELPKNPNDWFENASVSGNITIPQGHSVSMSLKNNKINYELIEDSKLLFEFKVGEKVYPIGVWNGSKFAVMKNNEGKYILLPEETVKLSPPPVAK